MHASLQRTNVDRSTDGLTSQRDDEQTPLRTMGRQANFFFMEEKKERKRKKHEWEEKKVKERLALSAANCITIFPWLTVFHAGTWSQNPNEDFAR